MNRLDQMLDWFGNRIVSAGRSTHGRYFWHLTSNKYVIFLAEFFLRRSNRTTVERFLPEFISKFPNLITLAEADPDEVVEEARWAGLTTRVRRLPEVAEAIAQLESWNCANLLDLPYIGRYAAEGIALYACNEPHFPIDNNVRRVVGRFFALQGEKQVLTSVESLKEHLLQGGGIDGLKAAHRGVLALGWDSCRSKPACKSCPLVSCCRLALLFSLKSAVA